MKYLKTFNESISRKVRYFGYDIISYEPFEENIHKYKDHNRLRVFYKKGPKCKTCDITGTLIVKGRDRKGNIHIDITNDDFSPLTIDHIIPKSMGGDSIHNLRPMCYKCNVVRWNEEGNGYNSSKKANVKRKYKKFGKDIEIGDIVYKKVNRNLVGEVIDIVPNPKHPRQELSVRIKDKHPNSLFTLNTLFSIKD